MMHPMGWKILHEEKFLSRDGFFFKSLFILEGPTFPAKFYVGQGIEIYNYRRRGIVPKFNDVVFYHRTGDEALNALIAMITLERF